MPTPFQVPEYDKAGREFFRRAVNEQMAAKDALFGMIAREEVEELPRNRVALASDELVETAPMTMESAFTLSREATIAGDLSDVSNAIDAAAESGLSSLMPQFFRNLAAVLDAAGQTVDAAGAPFSHDLLLDAIEGVEITFNDDGTPNMPTMFINPGMVKELEALPPATPEQDARFEAIMIRKREDFFARKRSRRLS